MYCSLPTIHYSCSQPQWLDRPTTPTVTAANRRPCVIPHCSLSATTFKTVEQSTCDLYIHGIILCGRKTASIDGGIVATKTISLNTQYPFRCITDHFYNSLHDSINNAGDTAWCTTQGPILLSLDNPTHYGDVIMGEIASQITSLTIVYSTVYSDADQRKHQIPAPLAFVRGIHRGPVNSPHKWPVTRKMFPFDDVILI